MLKGLLIFAAGIYTGVYVCQNYDVPVVDRPEILFQRFKIWIKTMDQEYRRRRD